jgi:hypothetical protein
MAALPPKADKSKGRVSAASKRMLIAKRIIIRMAQRGVVERDQMCASVAQTTILLAFPRWIAPDRLHLRQCSEAAAIRRVSSLLSNLAAEREMIYRTATTINPTTILMRAKPSMTRLE